ncbi:trypsin-like peptidase domain-containing protein [Candidatus Parcubacteria bacterium]|nr:trypsin-like peptidase domain-containing protein [Candidatus Parcubacteria bacterium]
MNRVLKFFGAILLGMFGAALFEFAVLPIVGSTALVTRFPLLGRLTSRTTVVNQTRRVTITEETALTEGLNRLRPVLVTIEARRGGEIVGQGSGFIATADGLLITSAALISPGAELTAFYREQSWVAQVVSVDSARGLALLRVPAVNLPVVELRRFDELELGERVFLAGIERRAGVATVFVSDGIVSRLRDDGFMVSIRVGREPVVGSVVATLGGAVAAVVESASDDGLALVDTRAVADMLAKR